MEHPITPPPPHLLKKFSAQAQDEANKRNGTGYLKTFATFCIEWFVNSRSTSNDRQIKSSEIQPPTELVQQWINEGDGIFAEPLAASAARWGADQELGAILEMVGFGQQSLPEEDRYLDGFTVASIRAARRPKPPSLKKQAYDALDIYIYGEPDPKDKERAYNTICQALEALPND